MALDSLLQQALKAVVEEIKGFSPEELERRLQDSKESTFAQTIDSIMEFYSSNPICFENLIISNSHNLLQFWQLGQEFLEMDYSQFQPANDDEYLLAA